MREKDKETSSEQKHSDYMVHERSGTRQEIEQRRSSGQTLCLGLALDVADLAKLQLTWELSCLEFSDASLHLKSVLVYLKAFRRRP